MFKKNDGKHSFGRMLSLRMPSTRSRRRGIIANPGTTARKKMQRANYCGTIKSVSQVLYMRAKQIVEEHLLCLLQQMRSLATGT